MTPADDIPGDPDACLESLADEAVAFALRHHPHATRVIRRRIARLWLKTQLDPAARTTANLAALFGEDRRRIPEIEAAALAKLRSRCAELRSLHPELFP